ATKQIFKISPRFQVFINVSLEGTQAIHDQIRAKKGSFQHCVKTLQALSKLARRYPNLGVTTVTTVMKENLDDLPRLMAKIKSLKLDKVLHYFEIIRGEPKNSKLKRAMTPRQFRTIYEKILAYQKSKLKAFYGPGFFGWLKAQISIVSLISLYQLQYQRYFSQALWPMPCVAGRKMAVIDANGDLRACELRPRIGNLRKNRLDFGQLFFSSAMKQEKAVIQSERCDCTHACFLYMSMKASARLMGVYLPLAFLKI
ncbi:unnamed protein product, partial [marine sediment metagenome]